MFLVTITHGPMEHFLTEFESKQFKFGHDQALTVVTDYFLSKVVVEYDSVTVVESLLADVPREQLSLAKVIIDPKRQRIKMFRSTFAGRPMYYYMAKNGELFCSSHISMLRRVGVPIEEYTEVLPEFFVYRYVMPPRTLYRNIQQVVSGSRIEFIVRDSACEIMSTEHYYPPEPHDSNRDISDVADETLSILTGYIKELASAKNRIAFLLSGGMDSSLLFKICRSQFEIESTFSTGYPSLGLNQNIEKEYAHSAADSFATSHFYHDITVAEYLDGFLLAIAAAEEPVNHLQSVLLYLLFKEGLPTSKDIVILGQGADGVFGLGLHNFLFRSETTLIKMLTLLPLARLVKCASHVNERAKDVSRALELIKRKNIPLADPDNIIWSLGAYGSAQWVYQYFNVPKQEIMKGRYESMSSFADRSIYDILSLLDFFGDISITTGIWSKLGENQKKLLYYPYNGERVLEYVYGVPWTMKLNRPKNVLRQIADQLKIPEFVVNRPKSGFGIGPQYWATRGGWFEPLLSLAAPVFPLREMRALQSTNSESAAILWGVLNYSVWKRLVIWNEPLETLRDELEESIVATQREPHRY